MGKKIAFLIGSMTLCLNGLDAKSPTSISLPTSQVNVQSLKTSQGINFWLVERHELPVISFTIAFRHAGSKADPAEKVGLCNLISSLLTEGAGKFNASDFEEFLNEKNIELAVHNTIDTFFIRVRTTAQNIAAAFEAVKLILSQPRFDEAAVNRVVQQAKTSLKQSAYNENRILRNLVNKTLYGNHPYGRTSLDALSCLKNITIKDMKSFVDKHFCKDNMVVAICGAIDIDRANALLDELGAALPDKSEKIDYPHVAISPPASIVAEPFPIPQSVIAFVQPGIPRNHPDFYAAFILMKILGDSELESRLWQRVREDDGLTYGIGASVQWQNHSALIAGMTSTKNESVATVIHLIQTQWEKMIKGGITEQELSFAKKRLTGSYPLTFTTTRDITDALVNYQLENLPPEYINQRNEEINKLTVEHINRVAKNFLSVDKLSFFVVGTPNSTSVTPLKNGISS